MNLADLRENYTRGGMSRSSMKSDPFEQFREWLKVARDSKIPDCNAMTVATANKEGVISSRTLLLKGIVEDKLQFFTNYQSRKAQDLADNPNASITLLWKELERQICVRGTVEKTSRVVSEEYFESRPYDSRIGAWVSESQSGEIPHRKILETRKAEIEARFPDDVPCPEFWGGYELTPTSIEFWQGREGRLHDRLCYQAKADGWELTRLSP